MELGYCDTSNILSLTDIKSSFQVDAIYLAVRPHWNY